MKDVDGTFVAECRGVCCQCGEDVTPGQLCRYWGDEDQEIGHDVCPPIPITKETTP